MGIKKLGYYIESNFHGWEKRQLQDCPVVLDGNGLLYYCAEQMNMEWRFGGQYPEFGSIMQRFFDALSSRNVCPICVVFDGIDPEDKLETLRKRKEERQNNIIDLMTGRNCRGTRTIPPPLILETLRKFLEDYNTAHDNVIKIFSADEEADSLCMLVANKYNCPLLADDSDFYISNLRCGYVPFSKLTWTKPGEPIVCEVYLRESFARSIGIDPEALIAIPTIAGNDSIPNLIHETSLKRLRENPRYLSKDTEACIRYVKSQRTIERIKSDLQRNDGGKVLSSFEENLQKAQQMYNHSQPLDEEKFRMKCSFRASNSTGNYPPWIVKHYRNYQFSKVFFEVFVKGVYFLRVIADDHEQECTNVFSRPIRQEIYGIMEVQGDVREVVRVGRQLEVQCVRAVPSNMSLFQMHEIPREARVGKLCSVLKCDLGTLTSVDDPRWHLTIASVCYWAKTIGISSVHDPKVRSLLLCFVQCFNNIQRPDVNPEFNKSILHVFTQWQCAYQDAILLNQILALPLPYLSPAKLFDGKCVSYNYQQIVNDDECFTEFLATLQGNVRSLFERLQTVIGTNMHV